MSLINRYGFNTGTGTSTSTTPTAGWWRKNDEYAAIKSKANIERDRLKDLKSRIIGEC